MQISTSIHDRAVAHSGSVILSPGQHSWTLHIENLRFTFNFVDRPGAETSTESIAGDNLHGIINLINFNNPLGIGYQIAKAIEISGQSYDLAFFTHTVGDEPSRNYLVNFCLVASA